MTWDQGRLPQQLSCSVGSFGCNLERGRDFASWLGLTPLQRSTGGTQKLGETSRMGERTLRRLLILGASATVRWAMRKGATADPWLSRMLSSKPPMLVIVALANRTARIVWALMAKGGTYRGKIAIRCNLSRNLITVFTSNRVRSTISL